MTFRICTIFLLLAVCSSCSALKISSSVECSTSENGTRKVIYANQTYSERVADVGSSLVIMLEYDKDLEPTIDKSSVRITATLVENMGYHITSPEISLIDITLKDSLYTTRYICSSCSVRMRTGYIRWNCSDN